MKIKICGLFRPCDISYVNAAMPDYVGFVFAPNSRRRVTARQAADMRGRLKSGITAVGVFVNGSVSEILRLYKDGVISIAQLHGGEPESDVKALKQSGVTVIKAACVTGAREVDALQSSEADFLLFDKKIAGGAGQAFDWSLLKPVTRPFFLAGGISPVNAAAALRVIPVPYALDISGGAENAAGFKDGDTILKLVNEVRSI